MYLLDGRLADFVRVFADAFQEVSELRHGRVPDLRPQLGDVFRHDGAEAVLTGPGKTRGLQLLQRPQRRVVPAVKTRVNFKQKIRKHPSFEHLSDYRRGRLQTDNILSGELKHSRAGK